MMARPGAGQNRPMVHPAESAIRKLVDKAVRDYALVEPGDRILVGASGGKDSTALCWRLALLRKRIPFELEAVHVRTEFSNPESVEGLRSALESWGLPLRIIDVDVRGRLKSGRKMNCWWCSTQRRSELNDLAMREGWNKIALGHHLDDVLETLFMNMMRKGELATMPPKLKYDKYPVTVIRPLYLLEERQIIEFAEAMGFTAFTCTCGYDDQSLRKDTRRKIAAFTGGSSAAKRAILASLSNIRPLYLPPAPPPGRGPVDVSIHAEGALDPELP